MINTTVMADIYFSTNYFGEAWEALDEGLKVRLLATAEEDIAVVLGCSIPQTAIQDTPPFTAVQKAIFEWALYLHTNKDKLARKMNRTVGGLTSVEVDGVGKETYADGRHSVGYLDCIWLSRAGSFLMDIERDVRIIR